MIEPRPQRYEWGQRVKAAIDLINDGSYPDQPEGVVLVKEGEVGEVVRVGTHEESGTPVYLVEFGGRHVVGCLEDELVAE